MSFKRAHKLLEWPDAKSVFRPAGAGAKVNVRLAEAKIGQALRRLPDGVGVRVGVLTLDSGASSTQPPLAVVCEFPKRVSQETLNKSHALAWNFCRGPLLITIEPHALRAWSCYEPPSEPGKLNYDSEAEITEARLNLTNDDDTAPSQQAARALHWVNLVSGQFFLDKADRFKTEQRVDQLLLSNLKFLRKELHKKNLAYDVIHDLLARLIFIQFLFQRKDKGGTPALDDKFLKKLHESKTLSADYRDLAGVLESYDDTYKFFRYLNDKFNGDLFPGKGATEKEREAEWQAEMRIVKPHHLKLLAEFVSGRMKMTKGQWCLWPNYSFDAIPLEFISSIYEVFVNKDETGVHYTRSHLVDFMLDGVLPWGGKDWDKQILDPACGSGIYLVKSFQRLVQRWKNANPRKTPSAPFLRSLLENNLFGVDINPHAVRVASFSLYLALLDEIDPRWYWQTVKFPRLRDRQVVESDFFFEEEPLFKTQPDVSYDLITGNAPWGKNTLSKSTPARTWSKRNGWPTAYNDIGPLFLPKAASLLKPDGVVVMIQPAGAILSNVVGPARGFRSKLFREFKIDEIVNLSALRFQLFPTAISPASVVTMRPFPPNDESFAYTCPKPSFSSGDDFRIVVEPHDESLINQKEAASDTLMWSALMWGGRRDLALVRKLSKLDTLAKLAAHGVIRKREGTIRGDRKRRQNKLVGRRMIDSDNFPPGTFLWLKKQKVGINSDPYTHSRDSTDLDAFEPPQLIVKQGWQIGAGRFNAALNVSDEGVLCNSSYVSVHADEEQRNLLEAACLSYNSQVAVYHLLLSSSRFASYRPEPTVADVLSVPIPAPRPRMLDGLKTLVEVDRRTFEAFGLKETERILIEDLFQFTLPDFKGDSSSPGRKRTCREIGEGLNVYLEPDLSAYCDTFIRVLQSGFGENKRICATIYSDSETSLLPVRLIAIHLDWPMHERIKVEQIESDELLKSLQELNTKYLQTNGNRAAPFQRIGLIFDYVKIRKRSIPTFYLIKPDQVRYWLRSVALRDADSVALDIVKWGRTQESPLRKRA